MSHKGAVTSEQDRVECRPIGDPRMPVRLREPRSQSRPTPNTQLVEEARFTLARKAEMVKGVNGARFDELVGRLPQTLPRP